MSVNKVILVGRLGKDPELSEVNGGTSMCKFSLATNRTYSDSKGDRQSETTWHNIVTWGKTADICAEYLNKGREVYLEGRLNPRKYEKDGETRYVTDVVAEKVTFLGGNGKSSSPKEDSPPF